jgi:DNA recombination protein RmuC
MWIVWGCSGALLVLLLVVMAYKRIYVEQKPSALDMQFLGHIQQHFSVTLQELQGVRSTLNEHLQQLHGSMGKQWGDHAQALMEVRGHLGGLLETTRLIQSLGVEIGQLHNVLRVPKLRGHLGEHFLQQLLAQVLPSDAYVLQGRLQSSQSTQYVVADAIIFLGDKKVVVDSKFPMESYHRFLKASEEIERQKLIPDASMKAEIARMRKQFLQTVMHHMQAISDKYILPECGTLDFALAYFPVESVYYEAIIRDDKDNCGCDMIAFAAKCKVVPVSPHTFYAYLLTISHGLKGFKIERSIENIYKKIADFQQKIEKFSTAYQKLGKYLQQAQQCYADLEKRVFQLKHSADGIQNDEVYEKNGHSLSTTDKQMDV